jgi:antitoxin (DNA-binding transcriptional repressor) of toxin-antitoxin stability system
MGSAEYKRAFLKAGGGTILRQRRRSRRDPPPDLGRTACYLESMAVVTVAEPLTRLADLISEAAQHTVVIVSGDRAVRRTPVRPPQPRVLRFGGAAGRVQMGKDFDEPVADFAEYS